MEVDTQIDVLEEEGAALVAACREAGLDAAVPTCPGWRVAELLGHIGFVHRWATRYVATAVAEMEEEPGEEEITKSAPPESERCDWVADGHRALVRALRAAPPDLQCWTFLPAPSPLAMWARRQLHETTVHRVDAELARGGEPTPVATDAAVDGIEELLFAFFGRRSRRRLEVPGGSVTLGLEAVDVPDGWTLRVSTDAGVEASRGTGECDVAVRGPASDLYLLLWHRRTLDGLEVRGSAETFDEVWGPRGIRWA